MNYRNKEWDYELEFPDGWRLGIIWRMLHIGMRGLGPVFFGPGNVMLKISSGRGGFQNLEAVVRRQGHKVLEADTIEVGGKLHDTVICYVPGVGQLKNFAIRFGGIEHLITTNAPEEVCDAIVFSFSAHSSDDRQPGAPNTTLSESSQLSSNPSLDPFELADRSFKTGFLLWELLVRGSKTRSDKRFLIDKGFSWIRSEDPEKILVGLNVLRFLFKAKDIHYNQRFLDEILNIFFYGGSLPPSTISARPAFRLAALDLLANMSVSPNPVTKLPRAEAQELANFRSEFMRTLNKSQHEYTEKQIHGVIDRETASKSYSEAMRSVASRI